MTQLNETVSPLRQRMIDDMTMRKLSPKTQIGYLRAVTKLAKYLKHSPAHATAEELRQFADSRLQFFGELSELSALANFDIWCAVQQNREWVVYAKRPLAGPEAVLAYLSRYTLRVAIANSRLREINDKYVTFTYKDYRIKGRTKYKTMQLDTHEFIRQFMLHVLPCRFHRIRHYGLLASQTQRALARRLLNVPANEVEPPMEPADDETAPFKCRQCHQPMLILVITLPAYLPRAPPNKRTEVKPDKNIIVEIR